MLTLLELELFDTLLIWGDGRAFYTDRIFLDGLGGIDSYLIVGLISVWKSLKLRIRHAEPGGRDAGNLTYQVVVFEINIEVAGFGSTGADESHDE